MGFKYKIDYIDFDAETFSDGSTQTYGNETRLRVFNAKGYELESVAFSPEEISELLDYVEVWEDHATCEVCADYAEKKRRAGNVDPHAEAEVYHNALFQEVQE